MKLKKKSAAGKRKPAADKKETLAAMCFLAPSLIGVSYFVLIPFLDAFRRSFYGAMNKKFVGFKNYITVFQNEAFKLASFNTIRFILTCIPLLLIISLLLALLINTVNDKKGVFKTSFLIPMSIPVASIVLLWKIFFSDKGLLNVFMGTIGKEQLDWMNTSWAFVLLVFSYIWKNVGYDMILWLAGISNIPPSLYEAAEVDGAGGLQKFRMITLPHLLPTLFTITVLSLLNSFKVFREAYLIAGDYPHESIYMLQHLFNNWFLSLDIDKLCAAAVVLAVVVFVIIAILQKFWGKITDLDS